MSDSSPHDVSSRRRWYQVVADWSEWIAFGLGLLLGYIWWGA